MGSQERGRGRFVAVWIGVILTAICCRGGPEPRGLVVDTEAGEVRLPGVVAKQAVYEELGGAIEYVACCPGGKDYESLFICAVDPQEVSEALRRLGIEAGAPARQDGDTYLPPTGGRVRIGVTWTDTGGNSRVASAESFVIDRRTGEAMAPSEWVSTGSRQAVDPATGDKVLAATLTKNLISLHQLDATVLVQNHCDGARDDNRYEANAAALPPEGTPVTLVLARAGSVPATRSGDGLRLHALIHGHVQGVGFRAFLQRTARRLEVAGWVRNLPTGEVEVAAVGSDEAVAEFAKAMRKGPRGARVDKVTALDEAAADTPAPFEIRPTPTGD